MKILNLLVSFVFLFSIPLLNCSDSSPDEPELKVENLTQDRYGLNWIKFEARKPENHGPGVEYEFLVMPAETGPSIHSPGASASPIAHVRLPPGQYVASVKVKDAAGQSSIHSRAFDVRGSSVAGFDSTRVEWGLGESWQLGHASATIAIPSGPMDYQALVEIFSEEPETANRSPGARRVSTALGTVSKASSSGCGSTLNSTSNGIFVASGIVSMVPGTGMALGPLGTITGAIGGNEASACVQSQITTINNTLAYQQSEITNIAGYLGLASGEFYNYMIALDEEQWQSAKTDYSTSFENLMGIGSGQYSHFMESTGLWTEGEPTTGLPLSPASAAVSGLAGEKTTFESLKIAKVTMENLWTIIGSQVAPTNPACTSNCYRNVQVDDNSDLVTVYDSLATQLELYLPSSTSPNSVPDYDSYNSTLVSFYLRSLVALQAGFSMEWFVNQYNFYAAGCADSAECTSTQSGVCSGTGPNMTDEEYNSAISQCFYGGKAIASLGGVPGTNYPPESPTDLSTPQAAGTAYNEAQKQLALLYAARANKLYLNTLNWIFSDAPSAPQAYPEGGPFITSVDCEATNYTDADGLPVQRCVDFQAWGNVIKFAEEVGSSLENVQGAPRTPLAQVASTVVPGDWTSDLVLYQFPIQNVYKCADTLKTYNAEQEAAGVQGTLKGAFADPSACPLIFSLSDGSPLNGGYYDGDTLQAYSWVEPEDDPSCPGICTTTPAATIVYTCGGIDEDFTAAPGDSGSLCDPDPTSTTTCNNYPATCLPSPNGALSLAYDIPSDWNTAGADTGVWQDATTGGGCTGWDSSPRYLPLGPAWKTCHPVVQKDSAPDTLCGFCTGGPDGPDVAVYSCKSCPSGHWVNNNGILECAEGEPKQVPFFTGVPNSFDNPPTLTTFCSNPNTDGQNLTTASCANAQWEFNADTGQLECGTDPASLCRGFVAGTVASCGDPTYAALNTQTISKGGGACAGSYGSDLNDQVCCGQEGFISDVSYICPADYPICTGYIDNVTWGTCQQGREAYTDCTQCGSEPVLTLSAAMPNNVKFCDGGLVPYTLPMSYAGNVSGLRGGLPYLSCTNWKVPQTFVSANAVPVAGDAIKYESVYQTDQVMVGTSCSKQVGYSDPPGEKVPAADLAAWMNTDWWCGSAVTPTGDASTLINPLPFDGSCGTVAFGPPIPDGDSTAELWQSAVSVSLPNAVTGLLSGAQQIPLNLVYQCSQNCPGASSGTSDSDYNNCLNVVAMTQATIAANGYTCTTALSESATTGALICTLIGGQQVTIDLQAEYIGTDNSGGACIEGSSDGCFANSANLEVGQANVGCPSACSQCESGVGGETPGGQALDGWGYCTGFCSGYNYCGDSNYNVVDGDQAPIDCRQCAYLEP